MEGAGTGGAPPSHPPCFRDPRRCPWLPGPCGAVGRRARQGCREETPHQESQRQGCALPRSPPAPHDPHSPPAAADPARPSPPCLELHGPPSPGSRKGTLTPPRPQRLGAPLCPAAPHLVHARQTDPLSRPLSVCPVKCQGPSPHALPPRTLGWHRLLYGGRHGPCEALLAE